jgi:uncharacterized membrane protein YdbT with pleckstrin-like domain
VKQEITIKTDNVFVLLVFILIFVFLLWTLYDTMEKYQSVVNLAERCYEENRQVSLKYEKVVGVRINESVWSSNTGWKTMP